MTRAYGLRHVAGTGRSASACSAWRHRIEIPGNKGPGPVGQARKDRFLVPLNSDFDLYSLGKDKSSAAPLNAKASRDDILRALDGGFIGVAAKF